MFVLRVSCYTVDGGVRIVVCIKWFKYDNFIALAAIANIAMEIASDPPLVT